MRNAVHEKAAELYTIRRGERARLLEERGLAPELQVDFERSAILSRIDELWREHLYELDGVKGGIGLRAYAQKDPLLEYKSEAFNMFVDMTERIDREALRILFLPAALQMAPRPRSRAPVQQRAQESHDSFSALTAGPRSGSAPSRRPSGKPVTSVRTEKKVGRNEPCPCGSGKKFKQCHGK